MTTKFDQITRLMGGRLEADARHNPKTVGTTPVGGTYAIDLHRIIPDPDQPRKVFDDEDIDLLAASLRDDGQMEPVRVRYDSANDRYVIVVGERRYRAAQRAGLKTLLAIVDDRQMQADRLLHLQLVENCLRVDLAPMEAAAAYQALMSTWGCNQQELARRLHISESKVSRALAVLKLPAEKQAAVAAGKVAPTAAVKQQAKRRQPTSRRPKPVKITTPVGTVVVTPKPGQSVVDVLAAAMSHQRGREAA